MLFPCLLSHDSILLQKPAGHSVRPDTSSSPASGLLSCQKHQLHVRVSSCVTGRTGVPMGGAQHKANGLDSRATGEGSIV